VEECQDAVKEIGREINGLVELEKKKTVQNVSVLEKYR